MEHIHELTKEEAAPLIKHLQTSNDTRLKKYLHDSEKGNRHHSFFTTPDKVYTLPNTVVKLADNHYMIIKERSSEAAKGQNSKVKSQMIVSLDPNEQTFSLEKNNGLIKIHFNANDNDAESITLKAFQTNVKKEASMLKRYNALQEKDVQLQTCDVPGKGTRIYMSMPSLGIALSKLDTLPESDRVMILHHALEKVAEMHEDQTVHFDITLNNLLYDPKSGKVAICDFGCAEKFGHEPKTINRESEPPAYNAAYDKKEHFSAAYDVFSLGKAMANFLGFTPNNNKAAPSSPSPDEENSDSGYKDESTLAQEQASLAAKAEAPVMTESSYDRLAAQTENLQKHLAPHPNSYNGPDDLFDFENSSIKNKVIIDLLKAMMAPNPADRPSAADCVKKLETALSLAGQNISASPKRN